MRGPQGRLPAAAREIEQSHSGSQVREVEHTFADRRGRRDSIASYLRSASAKEPISACSRPDIVLYVTLLPSSNLGTIAKSIN
jgi:hypothetical protein